MRYRISPRSFLKSRSRKPLLEHRYIVDCKATLMAFLYSAATRMHNIVRIVRAAIIVAVANLRNAASRVWKIGVLSALAESLSGRVCGLPGYPEKCTHRYCADMKVVLRPKPASRLSAPNCYCRTIDFWFRRSRLSKVFLGERLLLIPLCPIPPLQLFSISLSFISFVNFASILRPFIPAILSAPDRQSYR